MGLQYVYDDAHYSLPPGSLLIFYTDGVIEDRRSTPDLEQAITLLGRSVHDGQAPLDEVCDALMTARPTNSSDDATLLVTRLSRIQPPQQGPAAHRSRLRPEASRALRGAMASCRTGRAAYPTVPVSGVLRGTSRQHRDSSPLPGCVQPKTVQTPTRTAELSQNAH